jgi:hypothetical protein
MERVAKKSKVSDRREKSTEDSEFAIQVGLREDVEAWLSLRREGQCTRRSFGDSEECHTSRSAKKKRA